MGPVNVIVPNIPEAESMILMMNSHFPAFCFHYLTEKGVGKLFVRNLLREACCPTLMGTIKDCSWDKEKQSITTAAQAEEEARLKELENAAWYKDEFGPSLMAKVKNSSPIRILRHFTCWTGSGRLRRSTQAMTQNQAHK